MNTEQIKTIVQELLAKSGFSGDLVSYSFDENTNTLWFSLKGNDVRFLLGRGGEALRALNHLATKIAEKNLADSSSKLHVIIDANDFERKKIENLKTVAHMMAERARYFKSSIDVDPMPAHERKIVHEFLSTMSDIKTESVGDGPKRHIVIKYTGGI